VITAQIKLKPPEWHEARILMRASKPTLKPYDRSKARKGFFGWLVFIVLVIVFFVLIGHGREPAGATPPLARHSSQLEMISALAMLGGFVLVLIAIALIFYGIRLPTAADARHAIHYTFDTTGVRSQQPGKLIERRWSAFRSFAETEKLFVLRTSTEYLTIPKRALAGPAEEAALRALFVDHVTPSPAP
jgi:hypothetical protein